MTIHDQLRAEVAADVARDLEEGRALAYWSVTLLRAFLPRDGRRLYFEFEKTMWPVELWTIAPPRRAANDGATR